LDLGFSLDFNSFIQLGSSSDIGFGSVGFSLDVGSWFFFGF